MSYYSYIKSNATLDESYHTDEKSVVNENDRMVWGIKPDNVEINIEKCDMPNSNYKHQYTFGIEEFSNFPKQADTLKEKLINQTLELIDNFNVKHNNLLIETVWEGKNRSQTYIKYSQTVSYKVLNKEMLRTFFNLERYDYRSIEIIY